MKLGEGKCPHTEVVPLHLTVPNGDPLSVRPGGRDVKRCAVDHQIVSALGQDGCLAAGGREHRQQSLGVLVVDDELAPRLERAPPAGEDRPVGRVVEVPE